MQNPNSTTLSMIRHKTTGRAISVLRRRVGEKGESVLTIDTGAPMM
jgi:hypothetical protein